MAKHAFSTVEDYIASFPKDTQVALETLRRTIRKAVPDAEEVISYNIPAYKRNGFVIYFSGYREHVSLSFPPPFHAFKVFAKELARYEVSKSAVKIPLDEPIPTALVAKIAKFRANELEDAGKKKPKRAAK